MYNPKILVAIVLGVCAGLLLGTALQGSHVQASQTFGPDDVKSVPRAFIDGGDRNYTALKDILQETRNNGQKLDQIGAQLQGLTQAMMATAQRIDISNRLLQAQIPPAARK